MRLQRSIAVGLAIPALFVLACAAQIRELSELKKLDKEQRYEELASFEIECVPGQEGCNQSHLLKGDACFRLGKQKDDDAMFACASSELGEGIAQSSEEDWSEPPLAGHRVAYHTNRCEALREQLGSARGIEVDHMAAKLLAAADELGQLSGGDAEAVFFRSTARLALLGPALNQNPPPTVVCGPLAEIARALAAASRLEASDIYRAAYRTLVRAVELERQTARCI